MLEVYLCLEHDFTGDGYIGIFSTIDRAKEAAEKRWHYKSGKSPLQWSESFGRFSGVTQGDNPSYKVYHIQPWILDKGVGVE